MKKGHLLALGDSHLEALELAAKLNILSVENSEFCIVPGATVIGLRNPNSLTDAISIFRSFLSDKPRDSFVLTHLGEVDCGFVFWWRAMKYGESVEIQLKEGLDSYLHFLTYIKSEGFNRLCVTGASVPTINNGVDMSHVANKRSEIQVSLEDRTELTLRFNRMLKERCRDLGVKYFDLSDVVLDRSSKLVCDFFRNSDQCDHHLDKNKVAGIWAYKCNDFLSELIHLNARSNMPNKQKSIHSTLITVSAVKLKLIDQHTDTHNLSKNSNFSTFSWKNLCKIIQRLLGS